MAQFDGPTAELTRLLDQAAEPVYCVDVDRRIIYCNPALLDWVSMTQEQLIGRLVEYHTANPRDDAQGIASALCPPPTAFAGENSTGIVAWTMPDGRLVHRRARFLALARRHEESLKPASSAASQAAAGVMVLLGTDDLSTTELAALTSADPTADELHVAVRRYRREQAATIAVATIGPSAAICQVRAQVEAAAKSGSNVLVSGLVGGGRSEVARSIFYASRPIDDRSVLLPLDCALCLEDQLRRAIDSLVDDQTPGRTSVLLLEQLDQMPTALQRWLLDALPAESLPFRLMATVTCDDELTGDSPAATELLQLIGTIHIRLPALHSRHEDLPTLAQVLLEDCNRDAEKQIAGFTRESLDLLALYGWPGDVRELRTVIQEAYRNAAGPLIEVNNLPAVVHHAAHAVSLSDSTVETIVLDDYLAMIERELVERALAAADGNKAQAARLLGMTRPRLYRRLVQLGLATQSESPLFEPDEPSTEAGM